MINTCIYTYQIAVVLGDLEEEATLKKIAKTAVDTFGAIDVVVRQTIKYL